MRKVKFSINGKEHDGYFVGISGLRQDGETIILVEDLEGKLYSVLNEDVTFLGKPVNLSPPKYLDMKLMRNALQGIKDSNANYTLQDLINLAVEQNIIIQDTEQ